jgi:hypothetical protein
MIRHTCATNLELVDLYTIDEFGNEKLIFCTSTGVWEKRIDDRK